MHDTAYSTSDFSPLSQQLLLVLPVKKTNRLNAVRESFQNSSAAQKWVKSVEHSSKAGKEYSLAGHRQKSVVRRRKRTKNSVSTAVRAALWAIVSAYPDSNKWLATGTISTLRIKRFSWVAEKCAVLFATPRLQSAACARGNATWTVRAFHVYTRRRANGTRKAIYRYVGLRWRALCYIKRIFIIRATQYFLRLCRVLN